LPNEPVATPRHCFDILRTLGRIIERLTESGNGAIQSVIEVHERVGGPELLLQLLARHHIARALQQRGQDLKGLLLQPNPLAIFAQISGAKIDLEQCKANGLWECWRL
jgi:tRNA pseudouridine-54 N-methylase